MVMYCTVNPEGASFVDKIVTFNNSSVFVKAFQAHKTLYFYSIEITTLLIFANDVKLFHGKSISIHHRG